MPYIDAASRDKLDPTVNGVRTANTAGELNFQITRLCLAYARTPQSPVSYTTYNEIVGALECAKLEMYRRAVAPYEDKKIASNGDVFP